MAFYCTDEEKKEIEILAKKHGYAKRTDYMRRVCLGYEQADRAKLGRVDTIDFSGRIASKLSLGG